MIKMNYGWMEGDNVIINADAVFDRAKKSDWITDPFVKEIISDIDDSDVVNGNILINRFKGEAYPPQGLCGGTKMLILMYALKDPELVFDLSWLGPNCAKYFQRIAAKKDIRVFHTDVFRFKEDEYFDILFEQTGFRTSDIEEYLDEFDDIRAKDFERVREGENL